MLQMINFILIIKMFMCTIMFVRFLIRGALNELLLRLLSHFDRLESILCSSRIDLGELSINELVEATSVICLSLWKYSCFDARKFLEKL